MYLRRFADTLSLTIEHRAAPSPPSLALELHARGEALALQLASPPSDPTPPQRSVDDRILATLQDAGRALTIGELRPLCRVHNATLYQ